MAYMVRETVGFSGKRNQVVMLRGHRGFSALTSIMNYFLLTNSSVSITNTLSGDKIEAYMCGFITQRLLQLMRKWPETEYYLNLGKAFFLAVECKDIYLNPVLTSVTDFEDTVSRKIYETLEIPLYHVCCMGEQDAEKLAPSGPWTYDRVKDGVEKYKQSKDKGDTEEVQEVAQQSEWEYLASILDGMDDLKSLISKSGLFLSENMKDKEVGVLYFNGAFHTICKYGGTLFMLIDNEDILRSHPKAVWKRLNTMDEDEFFVDGKFAPISGGVGPHRCSTSSCTFGYFSRINYQRHCCIHLTPSKIDQNSTSTILGMLWEQMASEEAMSLLSLGGSSIKQHYGSSFDEIVTNWVTSPEFRSTPKDVSDVLWNLKRLLGKKRKPSSKELLQILTVANEGTFLPSNILLRESLFHEVLHESCATLRDMLACFSLSIEKELAQQWVQMAKKADNIAKELLEEENYLKLRQESKGSKDDEKAQRVHCAIEDIECKDEASVASETSNPQLSVPPNVEASSRIEVKLLPSDILDWPSLEGEEYFPSFVARNTFVRVYTLFSGKQALGLTQIGRKTAKRLLRFILRVHKSGKCWNGDWGVRDIRVLKGGESLSIAVEAVNASREGIIADLQRLIEILTPYYRHEAVEGTPAFFEEFHFDAMAAPDPNSEDFALFQKFMADHMAFMPPLARSDLFGKLFKVCDLLRGERDHVYVPLCDKKDCLEWRGKAREAYPFLGVYNYGVHYSDDRVDLYSTTLWDLLRFLRNYVNHAHKHTKVNGVQMIEEIEVFDLMLAECLGKYITKLILFMMYHFRMEGPFLSTWDLFRRSDEEVEDEDEDS